MSAPDTYAPTEHAKGAAPIRPGAPHQTQLLPGAGAGCPAKASLWPQFPHWHHERIAFISQADA